MPVRVADAQVLTPAPENRVERPNLVRETVEVVISHRTTDLLAHALHRLRGWPPIAVESLRIAPHRLQPEAHPEEVKPVRGVDDARLFRVQAHPQAVHDPLHPLKPRLRVPATENHVIVTVTDQLCSACLVLPRHIERVKIRVREQGRNHSPLGRSRHGRADRALFENPRLQPPPDQAQNPRVADPPPHGGDHALVGQRVKARLQIGVDDFAIPPRDPRLNLSNGLAGPSLRTKPVRALTEIRLQDGLNHQLHRRLDDPIPHRRYAKTSLLPWLPRLRDVHPPDRLRAIPLLAELRFELVEHAVYPVRLDRCHRLLVHAGAAAVPSDPLPRLLQHIASIDLVVHHAELPLRRHLGRPIQLPLEYPHRFTSRVLSPGGNHAVPPPRESIAEAGASCSGRVTALRRSYDPLRPLAQASLGTSASGLISSVPTTRVGGPGEVSSLLPLRCPCMLPPSPREPRRVRIPDSSPADISLRPTTGGSATPLPALAAISAGSTLTGLIGRSRLLRPAGLSPSLGCVRPHLTVEPSRTLCRSCFDAISCPITPGPRLLGQVEEFPRRAPCIPLAQKCWPRTVVGQAHGHADFPRSRDRDRQRRPSGEKVAEGSSVLLRAFHAIAREAELEAPSRRGIEGPRHRRQHRRGPERRLQHRPQPGPRRVERPEDEGRPRVEPGSAVGDPERVDPRAVAHPRHLAQPARRVSRVEDQAETGEPARGRDGWP